MGLVVLTVVLTPLLAILALLLVFFNYTLLCEGGVRNIYYAMNLLVSLLVTLLWLAGIIAVAAASFGGGVVLIIFIAPLVILSAFLASLICTSGRTVILCDSPV